jgi:transcriptional regulator with PAS, ATPase and Fis domain
MSNEKYLNDIKSLTMRILENVNKIEYCDQNNLEIDENTEKEKDNIQNKIQNVQTYKYLTLTDTNNINDEIDNIIRNKVNGILKSNTKIDSKYLNMKYMDFFFNKNSSNIVCTLDFTGHFIKINEIFSKYIGYTNEEICNQHMDNYIIKWDSIEHISDTKMKCKNTYKTKYNKNVTFEWYNITIDNCYYCIGKVVTERVNDFIINEKYLQLDSNMTKILNNFHSKKQLSKLLGVSLYKLNQIIDKKEKFNDFYYMKYNDCPKDLINIYELELNI